MKLVIATRNPHKAREIKEILRELALEILTLEDYPDAPPVREEGETFESNAVAKATAARDHTGVTALADDSGLEVDRLGGRPGVYSSRYVGEGAADEDNVRKLLAELEGVDLPERTARFRCVVAIAHAGGPVVTCEGSCEGLIALEPRGKAGFGYDPVFYVPELGRCFAELEPSQKNALSHRGRALEKAKEVLRKLT